MLSPVHSIVAINVIFILILFLSSVYHRCEMKIKMWAMNLGKAVEIPKLNEAMAIELGGTLLGEGIIFVTGAVLVTAEVVRRNI